MIIKRGRLTESGVELGGLGFIGDIQGFWKRAPFILVTGIAHIWWLAQLTAVPGNKIGTDMCRIFLIAVTTTPFTYLEMVEGSLSMIDAMELNVLPCTSSCSI